jgi:hypothetical protein
MELLLGVVNMVLILVTAIRAAYVGAKLRFYMEERYPEKAVYFFTLFPTGRWWRGSTSQTTPATHNWFP